MADIVLAVPGDLQIRTGGYVYDAHVLAELAGRRRGAVALGLPAALPFGSEADLTEALRRLAAVPKESALFVDGLAYAVLPPERIRALGRPLIALCHHPLALEGNLAGDVAARLEASERAALTAVAHIVATSEATAATLRERFGVSPERLSVAEPGVAPAERARGAENGPPTLLTVATVTPRKNHIAVARALARMTDLDWRWRIAGSVARDVATADALTAEIAAAGIGDRVALLGELSHEAIDAEYAGADVFVLASRYEGYGMAYTEALARGLPVIAGRGGASETTVPADAGAIVDPEDVSGLEAALRRLVGDADARRTAADAAWAHAERLPRWSDTADAFERVAAHVR